MDASWHTMRRYGTSEGTRANTDRSARPCRILGEGFMRPSDEERRERDRGNEAQQPWSLLAGSLAAFRPSRDRRATVLFAFSAWAAWPRKGRPSCQGRFPAAPCPVESTHGALVITLLPIASSDRTPGSGCVCHARRRTGRTRSSRADFGAADRPARSARDGSIRGETAGLGNLVVTAA